MKEQDSHKDVAEDSLEILNIDRNIAFGFSSLILAMMLIVLLVGTFLYQKRAEKDEEQLQKIITEILADSINRIVFSGKHHARLLVEKVSQSQPRISYLLISQFDGKIIAHSNPTMNDKFVDQQLMKLIKKASLKKNTIIHPGSFNGRSVNLLAMLYRSGYQNKSSGVIVVGISTEEARVALVRTWYILGLIVFVLSLLSLVVTYFLGKFFAGPVKRMALQLKGILTHAPFLIFITDRNAKTMVSSLSFEKASEQTPDILASEISDVFAHDQTITRELERQIEGSLRTYMATSFPILKDTKGETLLVCSMALDVTDRRKAEESLRESEENLKITLDSIGDAVIATDAKGLVYRMNPIAESLTGWPAEEAMTSSLEDILHIVSLETRETLPSLASEVMELGEVTTHNERGVLIAKDGTQRQIASKGSPIRDATGKIVGVVLVFRDITEEYALQDQLRQAQKMEAIGHLAGGVAHDFNNLLSAILGSADLLLLDMQPDSDDALLAESIISASTRAADLTKQLLAFSRKGKLQSVSVDINKIISQEVVRMLERIIDKRITIEQELDASMAVTQGDPTDLQNAILNLGVNARDAMPEGGTLKFATSNVTLDADYCKEFANEVLPGEYIEILVSDSGIGMEPEVQKRIFEPFYTTKPVGEGTGLGLAGVFGCVKSHHGLIRVQSEVGQGSTFRVLLPQSNSITSSPKTIPPASLQHGTGNILIVDDEEMVLNFTSKSLEQLGYTAYTCKDGLEAVEFYKEHHDTIDLVILDLIMPNLDGHDTLLQLKEVNPSVKVLIASGFAKESVVSGVLKEGALAFLSKPFRVDYLAQAVAKHIK